MMPEAGSSIGPEILGMVTYCSSQHGKSKKGNHPWGNHGKKVVDEILVGKFMANQYTGDH